LLCGYSPFRAEDQATLLRETMEAKIEFHTKYWKNVSEEGPPSLSIANAILIPAQPRLS
jgi:hypothetical protein